MRSKLDKKTITEKKKTFDNQIRQGRHIFFSKEERVADPKAGERINIL